MERIFTGAIAHGAKSGDYILRITSDCPLIDAKLVDRGVKEAIEGNYDQFGLYDQYPRSTQYADSNSINERNIFNKVMHNELLGRGIYLEDNVVTSSFSMCNSILVRFGLSFEAALGKFKSEM
eukprot:g5022.t1